MQPTYLSKLKPIQPPEENMGASAPAGTSSYSSKLKPVQKPAQPAQAKPFNPGNVYQTSKDSLAQKQAAPIKGGALGDMLTGNTQRFGKTIGSAFRAPSNAKSFEAASSSHTVAKTNLENLIAKKKKAGQDTTDLESVLRTHVRSTPKIEDFTGDVINKTAGQVVGEGLGTGLEALSGGLLSGTKNVVTSKALTGAQKVKQGAGIGSIYGSVAGGTTAMREGEGVKGTVEETVKGGIIGAATGATLGGISAILGRAGQKTLSETTSKEFQNVMAEAQKVQNPSGKYTPTKVQAAQKAGDVKVERSLGFSKKDVITPKPDLQDEVVADLVAQGKISTKNTPSENIATLRQEARVNDANIDQLVARQEFNRPVNKVTIDTTLDDVMAKAKKDRVFVSKSVEEDAFQDVIDIAKEEIAANPLNTEGLRKSTKAINARLEKLLGDDIYAAGAEGSSIGNARIRAAKEIRSVLNGFLSKHIERQQTLNTLKVLKPTQAEPLIERASKFKSKEDFVKEMIRTSPNKNAGYEEDLREIWNVANTEVQSTAGKLFNEQLRREAMLLNAADDTAYNSRSLAGKSQFQINNPKTFNVLKSVGKFGGLGAPGGLGGAALID